MSQEGRVYVWCECNKSKLQISPMKVSVTLNRSAEYIELEAMENVYSLKHDAFY